MSNNCSRGRCIYSRRGVVPSSPVRSIRNPCICEEKSAESRGSGIHASKPRELLEQGSLSAFVKAHDAVGERSKVELDETIVE